MSLSKQQILGNRERMNRQMEPEMDMEANSERRQKYNSSVQLIKARLIQQLQKLNPK